jgi:EmrB/QacA subfamily drug resistance transporter
MEPVSVGQADAAKKALASHQTRALLVMVGAALLLNYVETMIIPGVPTIQKYFGLSSSDLLAWVTSAFLIVGSAVSPLFGRLGDSFGKKRMFLIALVFYTAGVGVAGLSPSIYFLIAARAVQGVGFAIIPLALAIVAETFPRERIAVAQGIISATFAIGAAAGLVLGAYIIEYLGWQWAFHSAFVVNIVLFAVVVKFLPKGSPGTRMKVDYSTIGLLMAGVSLSLLYLTEGPYEGWYSAYDLAALAVGLALVVGFFVAESRRENPLIPLKLLRIRNVMVANGAGMVSGISMFLLFFALTYYTQLPKQFGGLGLSIIDAGLVIAPATITMLVAGPLLGRMVARVGPKPTLIMGGAIGIAGTLMFLVDRSTPLDVTVGAAVAMVGMVSMIIPLVNMVTLALPRDNVATGLGLNTMIRNIGGAIGPVLATTIMTTYTLSVPRGVLPPGTTLPSATAFDYIFYLAVAVFVVAILFALPAKNYTFGKKATAPEQTA